MQAQDFFLEFVSKNTLHLGNDYLLIRQPWKFLCNSRYYTGTDRKLVKNPALHRKAVKASNADYLSFSSWFDDWASQDGELQSYVYDKRGHTIINSECPLKDKYPWISQIQHIFKTMLNVEPTTQQISYMYYQMSRDQNIWIPNDLARALVGARTDKSTMPSKNKKTPKQMKQKKRNRAPKIGSADDTSRYFATLLSPGSRLAERVPSTIPMPTCSANSTTKQQLTVDAQGYAGIRLSTSRQVLTLTTTATPTFAWSLNSTITPAGMNASYSRFVAAEIIVIDNNAPLNQQGNFYAGSILGAFGTADPVEIINDSLFHRTTPTTVPTKAIWLPLSEYVLDMATNSTNHAWEPAVVIAGAKPGSVFNVVINLTVEYIPVLADIEKLPMKEPPMRPWNFAKRFWDTLQYFQSQYSLTTGKTDPLKAIVGLKTLNGKIVPRPRQTRDIRAPLLTSKQIAYIRQLGRNYRNPRLQKVQNVYDPEKAHALFEQHKNVTPHQPSTKEIATAAHIDHNIAKKKNVLTKVKEHVNRYLGKTRGPIEAMNRIIENMDDYSDGFSKIIRLVDYRPGEYLQKLKPYLSLNTKPIRTNNILSILDNTKLTAGLKLARDVYNRMNQKTNAQYNSTAALRANHKLTELPSTTMQKTNFVPTDSL